MARMVPPARAHSVGESCHSIRAATLPPMKTLIVAAIVILPLWVVAAAALWHAFITRNR